MPPRRPAGPTPIESLSHDEKRVNLPTADAHDLVTPEVEEVAKITYPRDLRSPMLVWEGKEAADDADLDVDAPPIYIQEKVVPEALVKGLRRAANGNGSVQGNLFGGFEDFDGLDELERAEFYQYDANWSNRMILGDSLQAMSSLSERERLRGKVQMIYLDPPYGIKFGSNWQVSARKRSVSDGKLEDLPREAEQIKAFRDTWANGIDSYLAYLRDRLLVARDLLTESGSIFVQIGDENVHLVRCLLDEIFGSENFCSQIAFRKTTGAGSPAITTDVLPGTFDFVLWYGRDKDAVKYRSLYIEKVLGGNATSQYVWLETPDGRRLSPSDQKREGIHDGRWFAHGDMTSQTGGPTTTFPIEIGETTFRPSKGGWKTNAAGFERLRCACRIMPVGNTLRYVRYFDDYPLFPLTNWWDDTIISGFGDPRVYIVQTLTKVVQRCMLMATDPGDLVLDPTCGSGTTAYVAEQWGRRWITIDTSRVALALARQRLMGARYPYYLLADSIEGRKKESDLSAQPLPPATPTGDVRHGFVYERVPHITLKAIANNPDIQEGMSREEIDRAIARHADYELLYDKPYEDKKKVRVTGRFTVESLSPHRNLVGLKADEPTPVPVETADEAGAPTFDQTILDNLKAAGVQNGKRAERLEFDIVEPYAGQYIQAVGVQSSPDDDSGNGTEVGIAIGPQYGTVAPSFVKAAAREARKLKSLKFLCVLGFAFEANVLDITDDEDFFATDEGAREGFAVEDQRHLGPVPVLIVRMNQDLLMGEDLRKTAAANLFTVFGQPDVEVRLDGDKVEVELQGVDVFDPTTGEVRSDSADKVALWMIDTDYDEESFFVRHCYFTGGQDPYQRLKKALKADINEEAWESLCSTVSRQFPRPSTGKIAVKVINDYGDEVLKVCNVGTG